MRSHADAPGLKALLAGFMAGRDAGPCDLAATAYPNPCNPLTTIAMAVPGTITGGGSARLEVYDIRGARVRTIQGGSLANGRVTVQWNGTTDAGGPAASGRYLYVLTIEGYVARGSVSLVR